MSAVTVPERFYVSDVMLFSDVSCYSVREVSCFWGGLFSDFGCCSARESSCFVVMLFSVSAVTVSENLFVLI